MKISRFIMLMVTVIICTGFGLLFWYRSNQEFIRDVDFNKDYKKIDALFHKEDNWYWLICNYSSKTYSVDFMLRYKTSSQRERKNDLILKVLDVNGNIAGFLAYYPQSYYVWKLLFLAVDQDYRRQGVAKRLLKYAVDDMVRRGAKKIELATRVDNIRAQNLYKQFGFKLIDSDEEFSYFSWYKDLA